MGFTVSKQTPSTLLVCENRTYVAKIHCTCGEELTACNEDVITQLFNSLSTHSKMMHKHICKKCNKEYTLENRYPLSIIFDVHLGMTQYEVEDMIYKKFHSATHNDIKRVMGEYNEEN